MKSLSLLSFLLLCCGWLQAQTFVSTTAENKNVVLEEFTGIRCTFCPDGHLRAKQFSDANPGDVVLVNIHVGSFASPGAGQPDFRTPFGTAIDNQAQVTGYPAGTINRRAFPNTGPSSNPSGTGQGNCATCTAMSRGYWSTIGASVLTESSPVNVANQSSIDLGTRQITSTTEVYYTAAGPGTTNKLNVIVVENNVPGPQTGSSANPAAVLPNGDYNHQHMLRHMLTGQWGVDITATTMGHFQSESNTYTIPADYNSVAADPSNMEVYVFVTESQQNVLTGSEGAMTYVTPPNAVDVATSAGAFGVANYCTNGTNFIPSFSASNTTTNPITSIEAAYTINGGTPVNFTASGLNLMQGQSTVVTFPATTVPIGSNEVAYDIVSINGGQPDLFSNNNNDLTGRVSALTSNPTATTLVEDFNAAPLPTGTFQYSQTLPGAVIEPNGVPEARFCVFGENSPNVNVSNCIRAGFFDASWENNDASFIFDNIDLSGSTNTQLSFDYAHALLNAGASDAYLEVLVSTDCGVTWTSAWNLTGPNLATAAPNNSAAFYPTPNTTDWVTQQVDLSTYDGQSSVAVRLKFGMNGTTGANNLYVDNINVDMTTGIQPLNAVSSLRLMPNPAQDYLNVEFSLEQNEDLTVTVVNALGQQVQHVTTQQFVGTQNLTINTSDLPNGVYFLNISSKEATRTERFVVQH